MGLIVTANNNIGKVIHAGSYDQIVAVGADGRLKAGYYWDDLEVPAARINLQGPANPAEYDPTEITVDFRAGQINTIQMTYQMRHTWVEGSPVRYHLHGFAEDAGAGNTVWRVTHRVFNANTPAVARPSFSVAPDIIVAMPAFALAPDTTHLLEIDMTGIMISGFVQLTVQRIGSDGADTYAARYKLVSSDLHYIRDAHGSASEFTK
jgi:hypothetical protein